MGQNEKTEEGIPNKFSPELKERAVDLAQQYGTSVAARMLGVSSNSVRNWQRIKAQTGSASNPDPRSHRKQTNSEGLPPDPPPKDAGTQQDPPGGLISSAKWLQAIYEIYAKDPSDDGFAKFKDRIDDYVILRQQEAEN